MVTENYNSEFPIDTDINDFWHFQYGVISETVWSSVDEWYTVKNKFYDMFDIRNIENWPDERKYKLNKW